MLCEPFFFFFLVLGTLYITYDPLGHVHDTNTNVHWQNQNPHINAGQQFQQTLVKPVFEVWSSESLMERCYWGGPVLYDRLVEGRKGVVIHRSARLHHSFNNTHMFPDGHPIEVLEGVYDL